MRIVFDFNHFQWIDGKDSRRYNSPAMSLDLFPQNKFKPRREVLPNVVQLGATLPTKRHTSETTWFNISPEVTLTTSHSPRSIKCPKFKNLYEYNQHYNDKFNLKRSLWKIPSMGNNFLPFRKKNSPDDSEEVNGLYRPTFRKWYNRLVHENTIIKSPTETSTRIRDNVHEPTSLREKKYILEQLKGTGARERFVRDEMHMPDVYPQCFTCRECQKQYASDMYVQTWQKPNEFSPECVSTSSKSEPDKPLFRKKQHCDVLGERSCLSCVEHRNKNFSLQIENKLSVSRKASNIHYKSSSMK